MYLWYISIFEIRGKNGPLGFVEIILNKKKTSPHNVNNKNTKMILCCCSIVSCSLIQNFCIFNETFNKVYWVFISFYFVYI